MELAVAIATVIIDLQVDFFVSHPRLIRSRPSLASHVNALVADAKQNHSPIFWIKQVFAPDLQDAPIDVRQGGHRITVEGTPGVELLPELVVAPSDFVIIKKRYSGFFGTELDSILRTNNIQRIVIAGINTHACVRMTAIDAYQRDYEVFLASDCIDSYDEQHHAVSMRYLTGTIAMARTNEELRALLQSHR
ncbi:MAG TPA: isochorismatase family cysteine hydrolase [Steroidobacteraceae bacterium]|jgi:nicotinamidase-related amidase|nr:isochorismatase family cysteine hydrolase [Steroidobacteraceae bacterium]